MRDVDLEEIAAACHWLAAVEEYTLAAELMLVANERAHQINDAILAHQALGPVMDGVPADEAFADALILASSVLRLAPYAVIATLGERLLDVASRIVVRPLAAPSSENGQ